ncbi:MAG: maleylpyruvate isomerase N-terminal domain-containing protein [Candidatus Promineifilaceae bacterium]
MNALDVLFYGHRWVLLHTEGLSNEQWLAPNVCGWWSCRDIITHLASFEVVLAEVCANLLNGAPAPTRDRQQADGELFNSDEVAARSQLSPAEALADYTRCYERALELARRLPAERWRQAGAIPWYGREYDLDDYVAYAFYGHKREHMAQVAIYRDTLR